MKSRPRHDMMVSPVDFVLASYISYLNLKKLETPENQKVLPKKNTLNKPALLSRAEKGTAQQDRKLLDKNASILAKYHRIYCDTISIHDNKFSPLGNCTEVPQHFLWGKVEKVKQRSETYPSYLVNKALLQHSVSRDPVGNLNFHPHIASMNDPSPLPLEYSQQGPDGKLGFHHHTRIMRPHSPQYQWRPHQESEPQSPPSGNKELLPWVSTEAKLGIWTSISTWKL